MATLGNSSTDDSDRNCTRFFRGIQFTMPEDGTLSLISARVSEDGGVAGPSFKCAIFSVSGTDATLVAQSTPRTDISTLTLYDFSITASLVSGTVYFAGIVRDNVAGYGGVTHATADQTYQGCGIEIDTYDPLTFFGAPSLPQVEPDATRDYNIVITYTPAATLWHTQSRLTNVLLRL